jgi:hypothetical protein
VAWDEEEEGEEGEEEASTPATPGGFPVGPARCYSPTHRMPLYSRNEFSQYVSMTWRAIYVRL